MQPSAGAARAGATLARERRGQCPARDARAGATEAPSLPPAGPRGPAVGGGAVRSDRAAVPLVGRGAIQIERVPRQGPRVSSISAAAALSIRAAAHGASLPFVAPSRRAARRAPASHL